MEKKSTKSVYRPSDSVKKRIAAWEGSVMTGAIDPLSGKWGKNRSFEEEASSFYHALPADIREQVISNPGLADNLFSYSYNVGAGRFKERVVPALRKYYAGKGSAEEIASSMWASGDKKLRGLRNRRAVERQGVVDSLAPSPIQPVFDVPADNTFVFNPFPIHAESTTVAPIMVPDTYVEAHRLTPSEDRVNKFQEAMEARRQYNNLMDAISIQNNPAPQYTPQTNPVNAPYVVDSYDKGGYLRKSWNDLSMSEKAEMMKVAVRNGITNLQDIRDKYNEFAEGGSKEEAVNTDEQYLNTMEKVAEENYKKWGYNNSNEALVHALNDNTYDYRGYYNKYPQSRANADTHWTDEFKTAYHPTFSNESIYSSKKSQYNPQGLPGGFWVGEDENASFIPMAWQVINNQYKSGGGIHIKPSHRGRLTELKKRTGKSEAELYRTGSPATRKMITFARNARKWKHDLGGNLFDGTSQDSQKMQIGLNVQGWPYYTTEQIIAYGEENEKRRKALEDAYLNFVTESNDATAVANGRPQNQHLEERGIKGAKAHAAWEKEHPVATQWGNVLGAVPFAVAAYPLAATAGSGVAALGDAAAATSVGQGITNFLAPIATTSYAGATIPQWFDLGLTSGFGAHGVQTAIDEGGVSPMTALDVTPMTVRTGIEAANIYNKLRQYSRLEKNYTGVPHKQADGTSVYMDESFPDVHRQHTVWATDDADYGRMFTVTRDKKGNVIMDKNGNTVYGKLFDVYTDPKKLSVLETPKVPDGQMVYWQGLPYKLENGKVQYADNINIKDNIIPKTKEIALKNMDNNGGYDFNDTGSYIWKDGEGSGIVVDWNQVPGAIKTDHVVQYSKDNGYHGTRFNKVYDGGVTLDKNAGFTFDYDLGKYYDYPINELVLNPGAPKYILTHDVPKYKILNQLPNIFSQPKAPFGILPLINRKND